MTRTDLTGLVAALKLFSGSFITLVAWTTEPDLSQQDPTRSARVWYVDEICGLGG